MSTHNELLKAKADGKYDLDQQWRGPGKFNVCFLRARDGYFESAWLVKWEDSFQDPKNLVPLYPFLNWTTKPSQRLIL